MKTPPLPYSRAWLLYTSLGVLIYGDEGEGTLKRYLQRGNCVVLQPFNPVSYTHLDVYKRQRKGCPV